MAVYKIDDTKFRVFYVYYMDETAQTPAGYRIFIKSDGDTCLHEVLVNLYDENKKVLPMKEEWVVSMSNNDEE